MSDYYGLNPYLFQHGGANYAKPSLRFGHQLSGLPNSKVMYGSPSGGAEGILAPKFNDATQLGGRRRKQKGGSFWDVYNGIPNTRFTPSELEKMSRPKIFVRPPPKTDTTFGFGKRMNNFINPNTLHKTYPQIGSLIY